MESGPCDEPLAQCKATLILHCLIMEPAPGVRVLASDLHEGTVLKQSSTRKGEANGLCFLLR